MAEFDQATTHTIFSHHFSTQSLNKTHQTWFMGLSKKNLQLASLTFLKSPQARLNH